MNLRLSNINNNLFDTKQNLNQVDKPKVANSEIV